jgi:hypothetical protein
MPLGGAAAALTFLKSTGSAAKAEPTGSDPIRNSRFRNLTPERCVLIKLILRLLHCRKKRDWSFVPLICRASG